MSVYTYQNSLMCILNRGILLYVNFTFVILKNAFEIDM